MIVEFLDLEALGCGSSPWLMKAKVVKANGKRNG